MVDRVGLGKLLYKVWARQRGMSQVWIVLFIFNSVV